MWGTTPLQNKIFVGGLAEKVINFFISSCCFHSFFKTVFKLFECERIRFLFPLDILFIVLQTTEKDLREIFEKVMPVKEVKLITDRGQPARSGEPRRYAFIDVESPENAQKLLKEVGESSREFS